MKTSLKYSLNRDHEDLNNFMDDLPNKLKVEVSLFIYESTYQRVSFLQTQSTTFIAWICPVLKPQLNMEGQYVYFEGDEISHVYFLSKGNCGFVLPKHKNLKYVDVKQGGYFGVIDIIGSMMEHGIENMDDWGQNKDKMVRKFTVGSRK